MTDYIGVCTPLPADCEIVVSKQPACETPPTQQAEVSFLPFTLFMSATPPLSPPTFTLPPLPPILPPGNPGWSGPPGPPDIPIIPEYPEPPSPPSQIVPEPSSIITFAAILAIGIIYVYKRR